MVAASQEHDVAHTIFGTITTKRVNFRAKKSLFSGVSEMDMPIRHVTSVRYETTRHPVWGILFVLAGIGCFAAGGAVIVVGIICLAIAAFLLWGTPNVIVTTGGDATNSVSWPWAKGQAEQFVNALRHQLFDSRD